MKEERNEQIEGTLNVDELLLGDLEGMKVMRESVELQRWLFVFSCMNL